MYSDCIVCDQCRTHETISPRVLNFKNSVPKGWITYINPLFNGFDTSVRNLDPTTLGFEEYFIACELFTFCSMKCASEFLKRAEELIAEYELKKKSVTTLSKIGRALYVEPSEERY